MFTSENFKPSIDLSKSFDLKSSSCIAKYTIFFSEENHECKKYFILFFFSL